ncbi:MAG: dihydroorotate dehydrogenase electron transfer subunit [Candidatus Micrarchaeia archaeon]|jgi:dihydroorotate dehydrogenase electron transfer subunit
MLPKAFTVRRVVKDNYRVSSFEFAEKIGNARPGQFLMAWLPGVGEKPFGICDDAPFTIAVASVGEFSSAFHNLKKGDKAWFRGPLGNGFILPLKARKILLVAGGYGVSPLHFLAKRARKQGAKVSVVIGGRSKKDIIFRKKFEKLGCRVFESTDDGTCGFKGFSTDCARGLLTGEKFDAVYSVGPERMMQKMAEICNAKKIFFQCSLDRYMKCGIGVCGSCAINQKLVCLDGPVFDGKTLASLGELGKCARNACGSLEYY